MKPTRRPVPSLAARIVLALAIAALFGAFAAWRVHDAGRYGNAPELVPAPPSLAESTDTRPADAHTVASPDANIAVSQPDENAAPPKAPEAAIPAPVASQTPQNATPPPLSWEPLVRRLAADGFEKTYLRRIFAALKSPPLPHFMGQKAVELYARHGKASLAVSEADKNTFAPPDYSRIAGGMSVTSGRRLMNTNAKFFEGLYKRYGVPAPFIVAVMMVETGLGAETGSRPALLALGSMAVTDSLDKLEPVLIGVTEHRETMEQRIKEKSDWAYNEVQALITYAKDLDRDAAAIPGSVYGAIGICQFMPSNIKKFAASTSEKRPVPDLFLLPDAAASVARYLAAHGWKKAATPRGQLNVLRTYNRCDVYASTVYGVATALMAPTTHTGAASARKGGNAVRAARENARASVPANRKNAQRLEGLADYSDALQ